MNKQAENNMWWTYFWTGSSSKSSQVKFKSRPTKTDYYNLQYNDGYEKSEVKSCAVFFGENG